jgi:hypothetical protein
MILKSKKFWEQIAMVVVGSLFIMGLLLDVYSFYNMTHIGVVHVLKMFICALFFDFFIIRIILVSAITVYNLVRNKGDSQLNKLVLDGDHL